MPCPQENSLSSKIIAEVADQFEEANNGLTFTTKYPHHPILKWDLQENRADTEIEFLSDCRDLHFGSHGLYDPISIPDGSR